MATVVAQSDDGWKPARAGRKGGKKKAKSSQKAVKPAELPKEVKPNNRSDPACGRWLAWAGNQTQFTFEDYTARIERQRDSTAWKGEALYRLFTLAPRYSQFVPLIRQILKEGYYPRSKTTDKGGWTYYNAVGWLSADVSRETISELIGILQEYKFDPFDQNEWGENAFDCLLQKHKEGGISEAEMMFRYNLIARVPEALATKIATGAFNRVSGENDNDALLKIRYCMVMHPEAVATLMANNLLKRRLPKSPLDKDEVSVNYLKAVQKAMRRKLTNAIPGLQRFFGSPPCAPRPDMMSLISEKLQEIATDDDKEALGIAFGQLFHHGVQTDFLATALAKKQVISLVRMIVQMGEMASNDRKLLNKLKDDQEIPSRERFVIMDLLDKF